MPEHTLWQWERSQGRTDGYDQANSHHNFNRLKGGRALAGGSQSRGIPIEDPNSWMILQGAILYTALIISQ
jgi:hypothetical protein